MSDLTLYLLATDAGEEHLVRGREDAERLSLLLVQDGSVAVVSCEAVVAGSQHEADLVMMADSGWSEGLLAEGLSAGLDIDPENFDPYAVLVALRAIAEMSCVAVRTRAGANVCIYRGNGAGYHIASYGSMSAAQRAVRSGAAVRRAVQVEGSVVA